jgi:hypothetical protein
MLLEESRFRGIVDLSKTVGPPVWLHFIPFCLETNRPAMVDPQLPLRQNGLRSEYQWFVWGAAWISTVADPGILYCFTNMDDAPYRAAVEQRLRQQVFLRHNNPTNAQPQQPIASVCHVSVNFHVQNPQELEEIPDASPWRVVNAFMELMVNKRPFMPDVPFVPRIPLKIALDLKLLRQFVEGFILRSLELMVVQDDRNAAGDAGDPAANDIIDEDDLRDNDFGDVNDAERRLVVSHLAHRMCKVCCGSVRLGEIQACNVCGEKCHQNCTVPPHHIPGIAEYANRIGDTVWLCYECLILEDIGNPRPVAAGRRRHAQQQLQERAEIPAAAAAAAAGAAPPQPVRRRRRRFEAEPVVVPNCPHCKVWIRQDVPTLTCPGCQGQFHVSCALLLDGLSAAEVNKRLNIWARQTHELNPEELELEEFYSTHWNCRICRHRLERAVLTNVMPIPVISVGTYVHEGNKHLCERCHRGELYPWEFVEDRLCCGTRANPIFFSNEAHEFSVPEQLLAVHAEHPDVFAKYSRFINSMVSIASVACKRLGRSAPPRDNNNNNDENHGQQPAQMAAFMAGGVQQELHPQTLAPTGHLEATGVILHFDLEDSGRRSNCLVGNIVSYLFPEPTREELEQVTWPAPRGAGQAESNRRVQLPPSVAWAVEEARRIFRNHNRFFPRLLPYVQAAEQIENNGIGQPQRPVAVVPNDGRSIVARIGTGGVAAQGMPRAHFSPQVRISHDATLRTSAIAYMGRNRTTNRPLLQGRLGRQGTSAAFDHTHPFYDAFVYPLLDLYGYACLCHGPDLGPEVYQEPGQSTYDSAHLPTLRVPWLKHLRARVFQLKSHRIFRDIADQYVLDRVSMHEQFTALNNQCYAERNAARRGHGGGAVAANYRRPVNDAGEDNENDGAQRRGRGPPRPMSVYDPIRHLYKVHHTVRGSTQERAYHVEQGMALVYHFGSPTLFITMTAGEWWPEFREHLQPETQVAQNMLDLVRVFSHKVNTLIEGLKDGRYFSHRATWVQSKIEFQKRGKPHVHILAKLENCDYLLPAEVDTFVSADVPRCPGVTTYEGNPNATCEISRRFPGRCKICPLRQQVLKYMTHRHYDERCRKKKPDWAAQRGEAPPNADLGAEQCGLGFPFRVRSETTFGKSGRWCYRRSPGSEMIVPYSPVLISKFDCHINTEVSAGSRSVLYLQKYFAKTHDTVGATVSFTPGANQQQQIEQFYLLRYLCIAEAYWQLLGLPFVHFYPKVTSIYIRARMSIREQDELYNAGEENAGEAGPAVDDSLTTDLQKYFKRPASLENFTIEDFYANYCVKMKTVSEQQRPMIEQTLLPPCQDYRTVKHHARQVVCFRFHRMTNMEQFSFILLLKQKPCRTLREVRTVEGTTHQSYELACKACGIFANNPLGSFSRLFHELDLCGRPIEDFLLAAKCLLLDSIALFLEFMESQEMYRYLLHPWEVPGGPIPLERLNQRQNGVLPVTVEDRKKMALARFTRYCYREGIIFYDLLKQESPTHPLTRRLESILQGEDQFQMLRQQFFHDVGDLNEVVDDIHLAPDQQAVFETIQMAFQQWSVLRHNREVAPQNIADHVHYINGMAGTGKTAVLRKLCRMFKASYPDGVAASSYTGIAALQLDNGRTCHNLYGIPMQLLNTALPIDEERNEQQPEIGISRVTETRLKLLGMISVHIIDEISLLSVTQLQHIETTLKLAAIGSDSAPPGSHETPFGGVFIVFAGDFHQTAPIVNPLPTEARNDDRILSDAIVNATVLRNEFFKNATHHRLNQPLRFEGTNLPTFLPFLNSVAKGNAGRNFDPEDPTVSARFGIPINEFPAFLQGNFRDSIEHARDDLPEERKNEPLQFMAPHHQAVQRYNQMAYEDNKAEGRIPADQERNYDATYCDAKCLRPGNYYDPVNAPSLATFASIDQARDPPHTLKLCPGTPVILLRNISVASGLTNGAIFIITEVHVNFLRARSVETREEVTLFRIRLTLQCNNWEFKRVQFPIRLAYAITINKSQGKTLSGVTILHLQEQCFSHGQLYVALSRVKNPKDLRIVIRTQPGDENPFVTNFVLKQLLAHAGLL